MVLTRWCLSFNISQLMHNEDPTIRRFRDIKSWDQDFRKKAWKYYGALLRPDLADDETLETIKKSKGEDIVTTFDMYEDGTPILFNLNKDGKSFTGCQMIPVIKDYITLHYRTFLSTFFSVKITTDKCGFHRLRHRQNDEQTVLAAVHKTVERVLRGQNPARGHSALRPTQDVRQELQPVP